MVLSKNFPIIVLLLIESLFILLLHYAHEISISVRKTTFFFGLFTKGVQTVIIKSLTIG